MIKHELLAKLYFDRSELNIETTSTETTSTETTSTLSLSIRRTAWILHKKVECDQYELSFDDLRGKYINFHSRSS